ncbi:MAG: hypothetical protein A2020_13250 [Lentisphaerae bacterium GWF2_45_14]|nr:MAG: hypothetical protein A2020_13250 [Lentisphaerae bacterium GWF2_45_14]
MAIFFFIFLTLFSAVLLEFLFGGIGIIAPTALPVVFYFSIACGWRAGLFCAIAAGVALDAVYGRIFPLSTLLLSISSALSIFWILREDSKKLLMNLIPAIVTGFIYTAPPCIIILYRHGLDWQNLFSAFFRLSFGIFLSLLLFPLVIVFLDSFGDSFGFRLFRDARDRLLKKF